MASSVRRLRESRELLEDAWDEIVDDTLDMEHLTRSLDELTALWAAWWEAVAAAVVDKKVAVQVAVEVSAAVATLLV